MDNHPQSRLSRRGFTLAALAGLATTAACGNGVNSTGAQTIDARVESVLSQMYSQYPNTVDLAEKSAGMLIMPLVTEAGFGLGGAYGRGVLRVNDANIDYYAAYKGSAGLQALVDGGEQKRAFVDYEDAIDALYRIIENKDGLCDSQIINIGYPENEASVKELAEILVERFDAHPLRDKFPPFAGCVEVESGTFYGKGYQDMQRRVPSIKNAKKFLDWEPGISFEESIDKTLDFFLQQAVDSNLFGDEDYS